MQQRALVVCRHMLRALESQPMLKLLNAVFKAFIYGPRSLQILRRPSVFATNLAFTLLQRFNHQLQTFNL
jgi:hypothetical protein